MKRKICIGIFAVAVLLFSSCVIHWDEGGEYNNNNTSGGFVSKLRGTWESNNADSIYSGALVIDYRSITISGYGEKQTPQDGDDSKRPFRTFLKDTALTGYSDNEEIFIKHFGEFQPGIFYGYHIADTYPRDEYLRFNFGGREEMLKKRK
jgi:hypothetical protein